MDPLEKPRDMVLDIFLFLPSVIQIGLGAASFVPFMHQSGSKLMQSLTFGNLIITLVPALVIVPTLLQRYSNSRFKNLELFGLRRTILGIFGLIAFLSVRGGVDIFMGTSPIHAYKPYSLAAGFGLLMSVSSLVLIYRCIKYLAKKRKLVGTSAA